MQWNLRSDSIDQEKYWEEGILIAEEATATDSRWFYRLLFLAII